jgi:asparagine synthase (glutamine-hydrolysing)
MCGINGIINVDLSQDQILSQLKLMNHSIQHRGPDSQDLYYDSGVGLGHARLSILDLSDIANQPMTSFSGRYVIVFNGEIYNFQELSQILATKFNLVFKTSSDTEVLVNLIDCLGMTEALNMLEGMFAFAVLDKKSKKIFLARDRFGEKPLYLFQNHKSIYFSSELGPLTLQLKKDLTINYKSVSFFLKKSYIQSDTSIFNEIKKIKPGTFVEINLNQNLSNHKEFTYWDYQKIAMENISISSESIQSDQFLETKNNLSNLLESKIQSTMISDVPLGAFLSGGYDSSCVVSFMQKNSMKKIKTFSIGFDDAMFNEAHQAKEIASYLGTDHQELYLSKEDLLETISSLPQIYSEPFADSSQIPTILLSKLTKSKVTVSLSGDGGDEIFGGYGKYFLGERVKQSIGFFPQISRSAIKKIGLLSAAKPILKMLLNNSVTNFDQKFLKLNKIFDYSSDEELFLKLSQFENKFLFDDEEIQLDKNLWSSDNTYFRKSMICDATDYLPGDILSKVDMAGMSVSLESRIPLLNHKIAEFASSIPQNFLLHEGSGKFILKEVVHDMLPREMMNRPKKGFDIPLGSYIKNELNDYMENCLSYGRKNCSDKFNFEEIDLVWSEHLSDRQENAHLLWNLATFFAWHEKYL